MSKLLDANGNPVLTKEQVGSSEVTCLLLFDDSQKFIKAPMVRVPTPKGTMSVPVQKMIQNSLMNLVGLMNHCKIKDMIININDNSSSLSLNKTMRIELGNIDSTKLDSEVEEEEQKENLERIIPEVPPEDRTYLSEGVE